MCCGVLCPLHMSHGALHNSIIMLIIQDSMKQGHRLHHLFTSLLKAAGPLRLVQRRDVSISKIYNVSEKKTKMLFFVISSIKSRQFWWNLVHGFLHKCAAKWCKRFSPHLNNIYLMTLEMFIAHVLPLICQRK